MSCNNCGNDFKIVNKWFNLCVNCNNERLHGNKFGKQRLSKRNKNNSISWGINGGNENEIANTYSKDNDSYKECFKTFNHKCEECGTNQPENFLDSDGKVNARWRYSHIVPKSVAPELRYELSNINDLCLKCHVKWEGHEKVEMNIYKTNKNRALLKKYFIKLW